MTMTSTWTEYQLFEEVESLVEQDESLKHHKNNPFLKNTESPKTFSI
jgi:hypothetical protein